MTIEERLEAMAQTLELQISLQADAQRRQEDGMAEHRQWLLEHDRRVAEHEQRMAEHEQQTAILKQDQDKTERALRRAIDFSAREMRNERKRRQELEALFKKFMERGGNGQH